MPARTLIAFVALAPALVAAAPAAADSDLNLTPVASFTGDYPVTAVAPPGDTHRLFVVMHQGQVRILNVGADPPTPVATPFLDIKSNVQLGDEQGLASIAFPPDYATSGKFYVFYSAKDSTCDDPNNTGATFCDGRIDEFSVDPNNPDLADPNSVRHVFTIPHHDRGNHQAGEMQFGPDGYLYIGTGDDQNDDTGTPPNQPQDLNDLHGKLLRIDPRAGDLPYTVPADNPFVGQSGRRAEIWAYGLRNPWRFSFDRVMGSLVLPDVGQDAWEEVNYQPADAGAGANYGWQNCEGTHDWPVATDPCSSITNHTPPAFEYPHTTSTPPPDCTGAIIGGYTLRDLRLPAAYDGKFIYGDFCHGFVRTIKLGAGTSTDDADTQLPVQKAVTAFGQDGLCRVYIATINLANFQDGSLQRIDPVTASGSSGCHEPAAPVVQSVTLHDGSPTSASSVGFDVTFSAPVRGVSPSDFVAAPAGGVTGASVASVFGSGSRYLSPSTPARGTDRSALT